LTEQDTAYYGAEYEVGSSCGGYRNVEETCGICVFYFLAVLDRQGCPLRVFVSALCFQSRSNFHRKLQVLFFFLFFLEEEAVNFLLSNLPASTL
jgi:hypothetical protein